MRLTNRATHDEEVLMPATDKNKIRLKKIFAARTVSDVLDTMFASCKALGGTKLSYQPETMFEGISYARSEVFAFGFPQEWVTLYTDEAGKLHDPVPEYIMQTGRAMTWREALSNITLNEAARNQLMIAKEYGLQSALGFPLWGPKGQNAFAAIIFAEADPAISPDVLHDEHMFLLAGHWKILELTSSDTPELTLSERERQVLGWIAKGKSNSDVASILAISPETVATYTRRIYGKLECHDRVGAVVKALRLGLIRL